MSFLLLPGVRAPVLLPDGDQQVNEDGLGGHPGPESGDGSVQGPLHTFSHGLCATMPHPEPGPSIIHRFPRLALE
jgi:hypothetical protein